MAIETGGFKDCLDRIAARGKMTAGEAQMLLQHVADSAEKMRTTGQPDPLVAAARDLVDRVRNEAKERTADAILNAKVRTDRLGYVTKGGVADAASRIRSLLYWMPGMEQVDNVQTRWHAKMAEWGGLLRGKLRQAGLADAASSPDMVQPIAEELESIRTGKATTRAATDPARRIAEIWAPIAEDVRNHLNSVGARIADAQDYIAHTSHDPVLMRRGGRIDAGFMAPTVSLDEAFGRWWQTIAPLLDEDRTFGDLDLQTFERPGHILEGVETDAQAKMRFAKAAFEAMTTGIRKAKPGQGEGEGFFGSPNLARKLSEGRVFFFKDAASWAQYMKVYGKQTSMYELMNDTVNSGARNFAMMKILGTNPSTNLAMVTRRVGEQFRSDVDGVNKFNDALKGGITQPNIENVIGQLDGSANIPVNMLYAKIGSTVRAFYDTVYLGAVGVTHLSAAPMTFTSEARFYNSSAFERVGALLKSLIPEGLKGADREAMLADAGAYADGVSRDLFDPYGQGFTVPGMVSDIHSRFMTATGLPYLISHFKAGFREMAMSVLSREVKTDFEELPALRQKILRAYGIGPDEWTLLRTADQLKLQSGRTYLTPRNATEVNPVAVEAILKARGEIAPDAVPEVVTAKVDAFRQELGDRLMMYLTDGAEHSVVTPGVRERAMWTGGTAPGSIPRELLASAIQYKTWPIAAVHQVIAREIWDSVGKRDAIGGLGAVIALSVLGGYMRMTVRDLAMGEQPRTPKNLADATRIGLAALAQGGGLGIFGDFLFGQMNRFGVSNYSSIGGPAVTDAAELKSIFDRWVNSIGTQSKHDFWPDLARWGLHHVPGSNLIYLKGSLDYLLMWHVLDAMSPGWFERTNKRMQKEESRTMQGYRPGGGVPYGIPGIYLQNQRGQSFGLLGQNK